MANGGGAFRWAAIVGVAVLVAAVLVRRTGVNVEWASGQVRGAMDRLGPWAMPAYVAAHTVTLALCLPYAVTFETAAALLFGFWPGIACVFFAKVLGASLSFGIGRTLFKSFKSAMDWIQSSKYFHLIVRGVKQDGWKFVLLARFSPLPSYMINYALAATDVRFLIDFLLPTIVGCLPMILQNASLGSLAGAAVASTTGSKKSSITSYLLPSIGIISSVLISLRVKKYSQAIIGTREHEKAPEVKHVDGKRLH